MAKSVTEFVGTFFLVFTIGMSVLTPGLGAMTAVAIAGVLMVMIYAGGHVSGAHYNPAATLAIWLRGACPRKDVVPYVVAQLAAGASASFCVLLMKGDVAVTAMAVEPLRVIAAEGLFTFALCYVILHVATVPETAGNSYFGLAIAGTVLAGILAVGPVSGASFNPAVTLGLGVMGLAAWGDLWAHLSGEIVGALGAAGMFLAVVKAEK